MADEIVKPDMGAIYRDLDALKLRADALKEGLGSTDVSTWREALYECGSGGFDDQLARLNRDVLAAYRDVSGGR